MAGYYHKILGLDSDADLGQIKLAYRSLAKKYHPDINKSPHAHERFIEISVAYEVLSRWALSKAGVPDETRNEEQEALRLQAKERAQQQAKMRYEKFKQDHEAFQQSGMYDVLLMLKYGFRLFQLILAFGFIAVPVAVGVVYGVGMFFALFVFWVIGGFLLVYIYENRASYFRPGKFYYSFRNIKKLYTDSDHTATEDCFYCKGKKATSRAQTISLVKVKDVKLVNKGPLQRKINYKTTSADVKIPRSKKAFIIHSITTIVKIISIVACILFLNINSVTWRVIIGIVAGGMISFTLCRITHTRSNVTYLYSYGMLIKTGAWLLIIVLLSRFHFHDFDITTSPFINLALTCILFFDSVGEQILRMPKKSLLARSVFKEHPSVQWYYDKNYQLNLEIPIWTVIYPMFKWIFG